VKKVELFLIPHTKAQRHQGIKIQIPPCEVLIPYYIIEDFTQRRRGTKDAKELKMKI
jgi:hypothetical protein